MGTFTFLDDLRPTPLADFWRLASHDIPTSGGVYFLIARPGVRFTYPAGKSCIFYIGQAGSLRRRLRDHLRFSSHVRENRRGVGYPIYWPRYEYASVFGGRYCFIPVSGRQTPRALERVALRRFQQRYHSFPVANSAGARHE
ncbi:MAG TPA: hypothetical protein VKE30_11130 [Chthoniobacterales bacterium]|nr:hypothetical protein [Chthoniobacterales bacterium]